MRDMSIVGEVTDTLGLLGKAVSWLRDRKDPARLQAQRLIQAFEAYGIARQQIPRVMPLSLRLPNAIFSRPTALKLHITPELLDWSAEYLCLDRAWLDGVSDTEQAHILEVHYKSAHRYCEWFSSRCQVSGCEQRYLTVWKTVGQPIGSNGAAGPLCLVYEELFEGLDGHELSRYWLLSDHWIWHHPPCVSNMIAVVEIARSQGIFILGRDARPGALEKLEAGQLLIPQLFNDSRGAWYPEDLVRPLPGKDSEWRKAMWLDAQQYLKRISSSESDSEPKEPEQHHL